MYKFAHAQSVAQAERSRLQQKEKRKFFSNCLLLKVGHGHTMDKFAHTQGGARAERSELWQNKRRKILSPAQGRAAGR
jgi:hypothetical protein